MHPDAGEVEGGAAPALPLSKPATNPPPDGGGNLGWRRAAVRVGVSALVLAVLLWWLPLDELGAVLGRIPWQVWGAAIFIYLTLHVGLGAAKWRLLVNVAGAGLTFLQATRCYLLGLFGNVFLPSVVGGDVVRAGAAYPLARSGSGLILGSLVDRLVDATALASVAALGILLSPTALPPGSRNTFLLAIGILSLAAAGGAAAFLAIPRVRLLARAHHVVGKLHRAATAIGKSPGTVTLAFALAFILQCSLVMLAAWLGRAGGVEVSLLVWLFVWPLAKLSALVPVTQGGIGVREAAQVALFAPFGVGAAAAAAVGLAFQAVILASHLLAGALAAAMSGLPRIRWGERGAGSGP